MVLAGVSKRFVGNRESQIELKSGICMNYGALCMIIANAIVDMPVNLALRVPSKWKSV